MEQSKIDRINELARKARASSLTAEEQRERAALYQEYRDAFRRNLEAQLQNLWIEEPDGTRRKLRKREDDK